MATVTRDGYQSEKRDAFFWGVVIVLIIAVVATIGLSMLVSALLSGCGSSDGGGNSNNGAPIYDENEVCVQNCGNNDDASNGSVYPLGDTSCNHDGCGFQPQKDYVAPPCHVPTDPKIKEWCMPYEAKSTYCAEPGYDYPPLPCSTNKGCYCWGPWVHEQVYCSTNSECRTGITCEDWPPEICQGLPCLLVGKWDCGGGSVWDYTDVEFYDNGDGYCRIHELSDPNDDLYYKPGDDHLQRPPSGPAEFKHTFLDGGSQFETTGGTGTYTCTKLAEE